MAHAAETAADIETICGDILEIDWSGYDVVFLASVCMTPTLLEGVRERAKRLKPGAVLITLQEPSGTFTNTDVMGGCFVLETRGSFHMSWGPALAHILIRQDTPGTPGPLPRLSLSCTSFKAETHDLPQAAELRTAKLVTRNMHGDEQMSCALARLHPNSVPSPSSATWQKLEGPALEDVQLTVVGPGLLDLD